MNNIFNSYGLIIFLDILLLILSFASFILCIRIVLRVEKKLDTFFKLISGALFFLIVHFIVVILYELEIVPNVLAKRFFDFIVVLLLLSAIIVMNGIIIRLDGEK